MKIDILSDLHFDNYFYNKYSKDDVINFYSQIIDFKNCGDVLVIAGDLGHNNHQNIKILKILKEFYKNIVCVLGNHDYYLNGKENKSLFKGSFERVSNMRELINKQENIYCLDGDIIEIDGIKFGGCNGWYNEGYLQVNYPDEFFPKYSTNIMWQNSTPDYINILEIENFDDFYEIEKPKIERVYKECDVMITHINPSAKIHVLVIPKKEIKNLDDATEEDIILLGKCQLVIAKIARQLGIDKSGYRVITNINSDGGQEVYHLHYHLLGGEKLRGF